MTKETYYIFGNWDSNSDNKRNHIIQSLSHTMNSCILFQEKIILSTINYF